MPRSPSALGLSCLSFFHFGLLTPDFWLLSRRSIHNSSLRLHHFFPVPSPYHLAPVFKSLPFRPHDKLNPDEPLRYIIAGPNGAGKTTFAREFLPRYADCKFFINADLIAQGFSPFAPEAVAFQAGRLMLKEIERFAV